MAERRRNLVVTVAATYDLPVLEPFLASWAEHARASARLLLFTRDCTPAVHAACAALGAQTREIEGPWRYSLLLDRHLLIEAHLREREPEVEAVLISDARDVIFQADPFAVPRERAVSFSAEQARIGECDFNKLWIAGNYGGEVLQELEGETIACAGVTLGSRQGVLDYLALMRAEFEAQPPGEAARWGDQGFHNYILHRLRPDFIALDRQDRIVQTLHHTETGRLALEEDLRVDGRRAAMVHQWDRHPSATAWVQGRYRLDRLPPARPWMRRALDALTGRAPLRP